MVLLRRLGHCAGLHGYINFLLPFLFAHQTYVSNCPPGLISISNVHKDPARGLRIRKKYRILARFGACIVILCLPLADSLNSLQMISIATGLIVWVLLLELFGMSCPEETWFGGGKSCRYTANCKMSRKDLESAVKGGQVVNVRDLSNRGEKGLYEMS